MRIVGSVMAIVADEFKGFCIDVKIKTEKPQTVLTTGLDRLSGYDKICQISDEARDPDVSDQPMSKKDKRAEKKSKKIGKKLKLNKSPTTVSSIQIKNDIRKIYSRLHTDQDCKLFQYESVALYTSDLEQILPEEWINDNVISLVYEYLNVEYLKQQNRDKFIGLISPAVVQLISFTDHEILDKKDFEKLKFIFLPVNETEDGDHWFLVVVNVLENSMLIYDSMVGDDDDLQENQKLIESLAVKLIKIGFLSKNQPKVQRVKTEQQSNFDDCGVYTIMISCYLINMLLNEPINFNLSDIKYDPLKARLDILKLIDYLNHKLNPQSS